MVVLNDCELGPVFPSPSDSHFHCHLSVQGTFPETQPCLSKKVNHYKNISKCLQILYSFNSHNIPERLNEPFHVGFMN